ncbi:hypothetical protein GCM10023168_26560 [Fodinibacter luteus]|uniref:HNH nuclease domain-containing protein n=1 Tax=Fodinibacter luteus TaxID=552064 RepID=A0ABP8KLK9_9MICO
MATVIAFSPDTGTLPVVAGVARVHEVLDGVGTGAVGHVTGHDVAEADRAIARLEALRLRLVAAADRQDAASQAGMTGTPAWLASHTRSWGGKAAADVSLATALEESLPLTKQALAEGALSTAHASVIASAVSRMPETMTEEERHKVESSLVALARRVDPARLRREARRALAAAERSAEESAAHEDGELRSEEARAEARVRLTMHDNQDGTVTGHFTVPALAASILRKVIQQMASPRRQGPGGSGSEAGAAGGRGDGCSSGASSSGGGFGGAGSDSEPQPASDSGCGSRSGSGDGKERSSGAGSDSEPQPASDSGCGSRSGSGSGSGDGKERPSGAGSDTDAASDLFDGTGGGRGDLPPESSSAGAAFGKTARRDGAASGRGESATGWGGFDWAQRQGQAFVELLEHLDTERLNGKVAATVVVTIDHDRLIESLGAAHLDTGHDLSASEARRLACSAGILPAVLGGTSLPLDLGRVNRFFSEAQRVALATTYEECAAEGCDRPYAWCELHHEDPWAKGGRTDLHLAVPLCGFHHRRAHDPRYEATIRTGSDCRKSLVLRRRP